MKIGVGVATYNRPEALEICLQSIRCFNEPDFDLFVADDGSDLYYLRNVVDICHKNSAELESPSRAGIAKNKNRILRRFKDYDYIFLLEDDAFVRDPRWIIEHLEAHQSTGYHHFGHVLDNVRGIVREETFPDGTLIQFTEHATGMFCFLTRTVLETVGGFDERFGLYGWEHMEYTERILKAGLCGAARIGHPCLLDINNLIGDMHLDSVLDVPTRKAQQANNQIVWDQSRRETNLYRRF